MKSARRVRYKRLEHLIKILQRVSRNNTRQFDMAAWAQVKKQRSDANVCGTACCAWGHAALDAKFQKQGVKLVAIVEKPNAPIDGAFKECFDRVEIATLKELNRLKRFSGADVEFRKKEGFDAAEKFFGITRDAAVYLFDPYRYERRKIKPSHVIARIREVIANKGLSPREAIAKTAFRRPQRASRRQAAAA